MLQVVSTISQYRQATVWNRSELRLCRFFGLSEGFWLRMQSSHYLRVAHRQLGDTLSQILPWRQEVLNEVRGGALANPPLHRTRPDLRQRTSYHDPMGLIRGYFTLSNPTRPDLAPLEVSALADSGAVHLCIPEHLAIQLSLAELERREVVLADGRRRTVPYVGPVEVRFRNRRCFTGAMVLGNEVLLGAIPMEDMDLVLRPQLQSVDVNPESPNIPLSVAKGLQQG